MNEQDFLRAVRSRTARVAATSSATRGKGNKGVVDAARPYLRRLNLRAFGTSDREAFRHALDDRTRRLARRLPSSEEHWGLARKLLNIYLRDCLYSAYLRREFELAQAERFFEVPLDSITAGGLRKSSGGADLPQWRGVRRLDPEASRKYQDHAKKVARTKHIARVHLDAVYWSVGRDGSRPAPKR